MLPISLTLEGLYSYQTRQTIDFTRLTQAQIFGIFGATGSGKSSILEAMMFALYGETERLNKQENRGYNMMNLRSSRLWIDFEFQHTLGGEERRYRFTVAGKRNAKTFDKVETFQRSAYRWQTDSWIPLELDSAESILGLSYDNFKRTVIIPQGKFQEFLTLGNKDRTQMLRDIFKLEKYELAEKTALVQKKNDAALAAKTALLQQYAAVSEAVIAETQAALAQVDTEISATEKSYEAAQKTVQRMEEVRELFGEISRQTAELEALQRNEAAFAARELHLTRYTTCLTDFSEDLKRRNEDEKRLKQVQQDLASTQQRITDTDIDRQKAEKTFHTIAENYQNREALRQKAEELDSLSAMVELEQAIAGTDENLRKGEAMTETESASLRQHEAEERALEHNVAHLQADLPNTTTLLEVSHWFSEQENLQKTVADAALQFAKAQARLEALAAEKNAILKKTPIDIAQYGLPVAQLSQILAEMQAHSAKKLTDLDAKREHIKVQQELSRFAEKLQDGEPCALCGAIHHPNPMSAADVSAELAAIQHAQQQAEALRLNLSEAAIALQQWEKQFSAQSEQTDSLQQAHKTAQQTADIHRAAFRWEAYREMGKEAVQHERARYDTTQATIEANIKRLGEVRELGNGSRQKLDKYRRRLEELRGERTKFQVTLDEKRRNLRHIRYEDFRQKNREETVAAAQRLREEYDGIGNLYAEAQKRLNALIALAGELAGTEKIQLSQQKDLTTALARTVQRLNATLAASAFGDLATVEAILAQPINLQTEREALAEYRRSVEAAKVRLQELRNRVAGQTFEEESYRAALLHVAEYAQQLSALQGKRGGLVRDMERLTADFATKQSLSREVEALALRAENLKTLKNMFQASGFVNFISTIFLEQLCAAANERFRRLTRGQLALEIADGNALQVRDYLHDGQTRSVKTLSGGQTFQAALSLAIALADQVQQQVQAEQKFFFIDEGFGSQDKESLAVIFDTLKALRKENRIVGIISHVEELQQEIDAALFVRQEAGKGSVVRV